MSTTPPQRPPITRLREFAQTLKSRSNAGDNQRRTLSELFNCDTSDTTSILSGLATVHSLVQICKTDTSKLPERARNLHLQTLLEIETGLGRVGFERSISDMTGAWTDATLRALEFVEHGLLDFQHELAIPPKDLQELKGMLDAVETEILATACDPRLKRIVIDHIAIIRNALNVYAVGGATDLERALATSYGSIMLHLDLFKDNAAPAKSFWGVLEKCRSVVGLANDVNTLLPPAHAAWKAISSAIG